MKWIDLTLEEKEVVKAMLKSATSAADTVRIVQILNAVLVYMGEKTK